MMAMGMAEASHGRRRLAPRRAVLWLPWSESPMSKIRVLHCNTSADEGWTADSPDLKGWSVEGASYAETKTRAEEAVREQLSDDGAEVEITHHIACMRH
jgi:predicted RNase H-like HicB family nuclease